MYTKRNYGFWMTFNWSKMPFLYGLALALGIHFFCHWTGIDIALPWQPVSVIGIAVAFYLGFKNNSSYDRTWEARKIWGSIVNNSRTFGAAVVAFIQSADELKNAALKKEMIYRHIAWMTALRYQLRLSRSWEHTEDRVKGLYIPTICEAYFEQLDEELMAFIPEEEFQQYKPKTNIATQILRKQSERLQQLCNEKYYDDFRHMELHQLIRSFYEDQGKSERIKNFPFPRQYASVAYWLSLVFCILVPLALYDIFAETESLLYWLWPLFSALITWIFFLMEKIGDYSENPFEGTYNDVPITAIARGIEIDIREMIDDTGIPGGIKDIDGFLM
ncbi:MAG: bestrophin family ion channel [Saprospiraceae bacterium]